MEGMENITDEEVEVLEMAGQDPSPEDTFDLLFNDAWFRLHPEKVLGEAYTASGRFGPITKYRGDISALARIEVDEDLLPTLRPYLDPVASVTDEVIVNAKILKPDTQAVVEQAISNADAHIEKRKRRKKPDARAVTTPVGELVTFAQMYRKLNPAISPDELAAFVWWKSDIGQPLSKNFVALLHPDRFDEDEDMRRTYPYKVGRERLRQWVENGVLMYFDGKLIPSFLYLSGDLYDKVAKYDVEKDRIVEEFGQAAADGQKKALDEAFKILYDRRIRITEGKDGLAIKPFSKFAEKFRVGVIESYDGDVWKMKPITSQSVGIIGDPDIRNWDQGKTYRHKEYDTITLPEAFGWWLLARKPDLLTTITHLMIYEHYVLQKDVRVPGTTSEDPAVKAAALAQKKRIEQEVKQDGERLFAIFLYSELSEDDKTRLENEWNAEFNNHLPVNLDKVPVAFTMAKYVFGKEEDVKPEKREAVAHAMINGTAIISYDVGVGKTPSAIYTISAFLDAGYCKRPCIVVPNQVYRQFISEIKQFTPQIPVNEAYNLGKDYIEKFLDEDEKVRPIPEGTITMMTYDGMENISFNEKTTEEIITQVFEIIDQGIDPDDKRAQAKLAERAESFAGKAQRGGMVNIEDLGIDFMCYDEAHAMKKVFTTVKGEQEKTNKGMTRGKNPYEMSSGTPSNRGLKGFAINQYILRNNGNKNVIMLTATPFTNSPLEIYSMLSMVAYQTLVDQGISNIKVFFDTYIQTSLELVINAKLQPVFKPVVLGFNNANSLRSLIRRFIIYKTGTDIIPPIKRPQKYVLPLTKKIEEGRTIVLPENERVESYITMSPLQKGLMAAIVEYIESGKGLVSDADDVDLGEDEMEDGGQVPMPKYARGGSVDKGMDAVGAVPMKDMSDKAKAGVRAIQGLNFGRNLAVSPYLLPFSNLGAPDFRSYIETSPKLSYVMGCIQSVRQYHISRNEPISGQVIFLDRGVQYLPLVKQYLVKVIGYAEHEVGIIRSGLPPRGPQSKDYVKNLFNGEIYNEQTKSFETVPDSQRIKVVIGTSTIKEGMNLQKYGSTLYNCFIDWNPTDMQQLEGRIWRQKNTFDAVRIVNALVVDSTDIFLFQKLQEKTARLQSIWANDNKNVIELEELNPEEIKYALIRDPAMIADLKIEEEQTQLSAKTISQKRAEDIATSVEEAAKFIKRNFQVNVHKLERYRNFSSTGDLWQDAEKLINLTKDVQKKQTDKDGKKILYQWQRAQLRTAEERAEVSLMTDKFSSHYSFDDFAKNFRELKKAKKNYLDQYGITLDWDYIDISLKPLKDKIQQQKEVLSKEYEKLKSKEYRQQKIDEVVAEKEKLKIRERSLSESVQDFAKLNYLLNKTKVDVPAQPMFTTCPPKDKDGKNAITPEALSYLRTCVSKEPQTRDLYIQSDGTYRPDRRALHDEIIQETFDGVRCVKRDKPVAILMGGSPGSGKTTFLQNNAAWLLRPSVFHIDADAIREKLPEYKGWNAQATHLEARDIVERILSELGSERCRFDIIYDGTMARAERYHGLVRRLKNLGYEVFAIFMDIPYSEAKSRVLDRYREGGEKGRYVDVSIIDQFFEKVGDKTRGQASLDALKPSLDGYIVADGITGRILETGGKPMPKQRSEDIYGESVGAKVKKVAPEPAPVVDKASIEKKIAALRKVAAFLDGEEQAQAKRRIKGLEMVISLM